MKGIIMQPDSVRAILAGRKTQTRRLVKIPRWSGNDEEIELHYEPKFGDHWPCVIAESSGCLAPIPTRYRVGEVLYIKESWGIGGARLVDPCLNYRADGAQHPMIACADFDWHVPAQGDRLLGINDKTLLAVKDGWRSAMYMPEWASRIHLEITEVRCQRVQEITEEDAEAEGIDGNDALVGQIVNPYRTAYADLWDRINPKQPWESDPFVFSYTFRRLSDRPIE